MGLKGAGQEYGGSGGGNPLNAFIGMIFSGHGHELLLNRRVLLISVFSIGLLLVFLFAPQFINNNNQTIPIGKNVGVGGETSILLTEAQVLTIAGGEQITKDFILRNPKYSTKVTYINKEMLKGLLVSAPAIYSDLPEEGFYKVEYTSQKEGLLNFIDPKSKEVLKYYRVKKIKL